MTARENTIAVLLNQAADRSTDPEFQVRVAAVVDYLAKVDEGAERFLTVVIRTQGLRLEPLKDALLCLEAQSNEDFDVVVVVHNAAPANAAAVRAAVQQTPAGFRDRVRVVDVVGGTRARPLNVGVEQSTGRYIAFYDDDDILFGHWVESFATASESSPGMLLRAVVANQAVEPEVWSTGGAGLRSMSWPKPEWDERFDLVSHLLVNKSPFMSWAFPRSLFFTLGVRFDEQLEVAEDWDVILQGAMLLGVADVPALTSIYRRWTNAESSYTLHSGDAWRASEQRVIDRVDAMVLSLPPGSSSALRSQTLYTEALRQYRNLFNGHQLRQPLLAGWRAAAPAVRLAVRVRNKLRRMRGVR